MAPVHLSCAGRSNIFCLLHERPAMKCAELMSAQLFQALTVPLFMLFDMTVSNFFEHGSFLLISSDFMP